MTNVDYSDPGGLSCSPISVSPAWRAPAGGLPGSGHSLVGAGFVRADAWRCMDRSDKIGKRRVDQPFEANLPINPISSLVRWYFIS